MRPGVICGKIGIDPIIMNFKDPNQKNKLNKINQNIIYK